MTFNIHLAASFTLVFIPTLACTLHIVIMDARSPVTTEETRALAPFMQQPTDSFIRDCKEELLGITMRLDEVQTASFRSHKDPRTRREITRKLADNNNNPSSVTKLPVSGKKEQCTIF